MQNIISRRMPGYIPGGILPHVQWLKWLNYVPDFQKDRLDFINCKALSNLNLADSIFLQEMEKNNELIKLFDRFSSGECSVQDRIDVMKYVESDGKLEKLMLSKLTFEELSDVKQKISLLRQNSEFLESMLYVMWDVNIYSELSMVDSFVAYCAAEMRSNVDISKLEVSVDDRIINNRMNYYR